MLSVQVPTLALRSSARYPSDNCAAAYNTGMAFSRYTESLRLTRTDSLGTQVRQPQDMLPMYLTHATGIRVAQQYLNVSQLAQEIGKPFMMFETNTASCGGFPGISDAFAAALWGLDYGLMLAYSNFTGALFHVGGQNVYYNVSSLLTRFITYQF